MLAPLLALAMQVPVDLSKASELYHDCKTYIALIDKTRVGDDGEFLDAGNCIGYLTGYMDAAGSRLGFCCAGTTAATAVRVYIAYMDKNPKLFDSPRGVTVAFALADAYPCKTK
jgi:hypothetical protein